MTNKQLNAIKNRIQKANRSFSVMGDMLLIMDIQEKWTIDELAAIYVYCAEKGVFYKELTQKVFK